MTIDKDFLNKLACPKCGGRLEGRGGNLACTSCAGLYEVRQGVPILLADKSVDVSFDKYTQTKTESIEFYESFYKGHFDYQRFANSDKSFAKVIFKKLKFATPNPVILDLGAGTGYFGKLFEELDLGLDVYNADFSYEGFRTAQEIYGLNKLAVMDAYRVAFLPETIDALFAIGLTPFKKKELDQVSFLIEQIIKPIKKDGYFVFIWSSNLRDTVEHIKTIRSDQEITETYYYNHSRSFIEKAFAATGQFSEVEGFVFLRPLSVLGSISLSWAITKFMELLMRILPKSLTARIVVIGKKK